LGVEAAVFGDRRESVSEYDFAESVSLDEGRLELLPRAASRVLEMVAILYLLHPIRTNLDLFQLLSRQINRKQRGKVTKIKLVLRNVSHA
jgi:hypothetical protein